MKEFAKSLKNIRKTFKGKLNLRFVKTGRLERDKADARVILIPMNMDAKKIENFLKLAVLKDRVEARRAA